MSNQIVISAAQMTLAGFARQQIVVSKGYVCPDCGGSNPTATIAEAMETASTR